MPTALRFLIALAQRWRVVVRTVPPSGHGIPIVGIVVTFVPENELDIYAALGFGLWADIRARAPEPSVYDR